MKTVELTLYSFDELSEEAQETATNDLIKDMIDYESDDHYENWPEFRKAVDKATQMQTPWFAGAYLWEYCKEDILLRLRDYGDQFTPDGKLHF